MLAQGLVILSQNDSDAPALPGIATVSKSDAWDDGGRALGEQAAAAGRLWVDRPYWTGVPDLDWVVDKVNRVTRAGGVCQLGNEANLELEGWQGGPPAWHDFDAAVRAAVESPERLLAMPPSPGVPDWADWVTTMGPYAVHAYGGFDQLVAVVQWYVDNTSGELYVTECNPGAGQPFDLDAWARSDLVQFLDWCAGWDRIRFLSYFAYSWNESANLPSSIDAKGTQVEAVLREWTPPGEVPVSGDIVLSVPMENAPASPANYSGARTWTRGVVVHCTRGGASSPEQEYLGTCGWFQNPAAQVSAHLVVGPAAVARCVPDAATAWHARSANDDRLGLEIAQATLSTPISDFQYAAAAEACRLWSEKYGFPIERVIGEGPAGLVGHEDCESGWADGKSDPGSTPDGVFDWDRFVRECRQEEPPATFDIDAARDQVWALATTLEENGWDWYGQALKSATALSKGDK